MVNKLALPPTPNEVIEKINEIIDNKQDAISDLETIRSGANAGATAVQPSELESYATSDYVDDELAEKVSKSGDTMTGDLVINGALYLTNVSGSVHSSVSKLYFGSSTKPTNYISANNTGAFGIYNSTKSGVTCYPGVNFFPEGTTKTTNLGRTDKRWNIGYIISLFGNTKQETVDNIITGAINGTEALNTKQDTLVSGTNIKTINNQSLLGSGNIDIQGGGTSVEAFTAAEVQTIWESV